jgi:hypothetical protein
MGKGAWCDVGLNSWPKRFDSNKNVGYTNKKNVQLGKMELEKVRVGEVREGSDRKIRRCRKFIAEDAPWHKNSGSLDS